MAESEPLASELRALLTRRSQPGRLSWIGVRPARGAEMRLLDRAQLLTGRGIEGDRASANSGGKRQVSLIQAEHLPVVAALLERESVPPELLRRNLVVRGINLSALRSTTFRVGEVLLRGSGFCEPCSKLERALGFGGYNAMRGHGGILARVLRGGTIQLHDEVDFAGDDPETAGEETDPPRT